MSLLPADFHFLRPDWLFALIPAVLLALVAFRQSGRGRNDWRGLVEAHLLRHLVVKDKGARGKWPVALLLLGWILATLAAAGPAWQKVPVPALEENDPTVVILSLAQAMNAPDQSPDRLTAARFKVEDLLRRNRGGQTALVIFADAPFVAAPLTEDGRVIAQMLPELSTDLMPVLNDRPDFAIRQAVDLLKNTGATTGRILLATSGPGDAPERTVMAARAAATAGYRVNVLGIGGETALPVTGPDGRALKARDGTALTTKLDVAGLREVAEAGDGRFERITADGRDLDALLARAAAPGSQAAFQKSGLTADQWVDMGPWLLPILAVFAAFAFRRGLVAVLVISAGAALVQPVRAQDVPGAGLSWNELWRTPDQRGAAAFDAQDFAGAASTFKDPAWQASALYRAGEYDRAASAYSGGANADFNRGNALARAGKLQEALDAYDAALAKGPDEDASFNRELVRKALEQQKNQQNQQNQGGGQQKQDSGGDKSSQNQQKPSDQQKNEGQQKPEQKPGDQPQNGQQPPQQQPKPDPKAEGKPDQKPDPKSDPAKPDPAKQAPAKPDPAKPDPAKSNPAKSDPTKPPQDKAAGDKPQAPPPQPPSGPDQQPGQPPGTVAVRPMTEQDQNREQTLRMVPDDPVGLLRARIRAYYTGILRPTVEDR